MNQAAIGIDIGGTKIALVLGTKQGKVLARRQFPTPLGRKAKQALFEIDQIITDFLTIARLKKIKVVGVGIGLPGAVNSLKGEVPYSPNLPGWTHLPLRKSIQSKFKLPVFMANDANAAACAEHMFGTAKKVRDFVYMTVSTGVGGGIFIDGKLLHGAGYAAGEIGHIPVVVDGRDYGRGRKGGLEAYASGTAIGKRYAQMLGKKKSSAKEAAFDAGRKNKKALKVFQEAGDYLGVGLATILNILNPEMVIFSGGVFKSAPPIFLKSAFARCKKLAWKEAYQSCVFKKSVLKGAAGDLGSLALVFLHQK